MPASTLDGSGDFINWLTDLIETSPSPSMWSSFYFMLQYTHHNYGCGRSFVRVYTGSSKLSGMVIWPTALSSPTMLESGWSRKLWWFGQRSAVVVGGKQVWGQYDHPHKKFRSVNNSIKAKVENTTYGVGRLLSTMSQVSYPLWLYLILVSNVRCVVIISPFCNPPERLFSTYSQLFGNALPVGLSSSISIICERYRQSLTSRGYQLA